MEIILLKDINGVGREGDTVKTKDGYARNFLIPRKLACPSSSAAIKALKARRKRTVEETEKEKGKLQATAKRLSELSLTIPMESGMDDALFGTVTNEKICNALRQENLHIDKKSIILNEAIKKLGIYNVEVKLHPEVKAGLRVWVVKK